MTRSGEFSPKNVTNFGYFPTNLKNFWHILRQIAEVWAISLPKFLFWHFLELFWLLLGIQSGSSGRLGRKFTNIDLAVMWFAKKGAAMLAIVMTH